MYVNVGRKLHRHKCRVMLGNSKRTVKFSNVSVGHQNC